MSKEEWKAQYRLWRSAVSSISRGEVNKGLTQKEQDQLWEIFWFGVYDRMPKAVYSAVAADRWKTTSPWKLTSRSALACNVQHLPNSYPRECRNSGALT